MQHVIINREPEFVEDLDCLTEELEDLKVEGIVVHDSDCNKGDGFIVVANKDISRMKELGYEINGDITCNGVVRVTFEPKSFCAGLCTESEEEIPIYVLKDEKKDVCICQCYMTKKLIEFLNRNNISVTESIATE